jgi:NitT/TauT family transport system permease protein
MGSPREEIAARGSVADTARVDGVIASVPSRRPRNLRRAVRPARWLPAVVAAAAVAVVWQIVALHNPLDLPRIGAVWNALATNRSIYWHDTLATLYEMVVGLVASFVVAFSLAVAMCHSRVLDRAIMPLAVTLNVTPIIALAPGLAIALGFGYAPKFVVTAVIVFFPFLVNGLAGLRSVDPEVLEVFRTLDASRWEILTRLRLPSSLPFLFAAARVCFPLSLVGAVVSEFATTSYTGGLGVLINSAATSGGTLGLAEIYGAVAILAFLGLVLTLIVAGAEGRLLSWQEGSSAIE